MSPSIALQVPRAAIRRSIVPKLSMLMVLVPLLAGGGPGVAPLLRPPSKYSVDVVPTKCVSLRRYRKSVFYPSQRIFRLSGFQLLGNAVPVGTDELFVQREYVSTPHGRLRFWQWFD